MLKSVGDSRHPCRTPTVVRNQSPILYVEYFKQHKFGLMQEFVMVIVHALWVVHATMSKLVILILGKSRFDCFGLACVGTVASHSIVTKLVSKILKMFGLVCGKCSCHALHFIDSFQTLYTCLIKCKLKV